MSRKSNYRHKKKKNDVSENEQRGYTRIRNETQNNFQVGNKPNNQHSVFQGHLSPHSTGRSFSTQYLNNDCSRFSYHKQHGTNESEMNYNYSLDAENQYLTRNSVFSQQQTGLEFGFKCVSQQNKSSDDIVQHPSEFTRCNKFDSQDFLQYNEEARVKLPANLISQDRNDKVSLLRNLKAFYDDTLRTINPSDIVKKYRQQIVNRTETYLEKHQKRIEILSFQISAADNKDKAILLKHLNIIKLQQKTFELYVANIRSQFSDIYDLPPSAIASKSEIILQEVEKECKLFKKLFPAYALRDDIMSIVKQNQVTIISAEDCYYVNAVIPLCIQNLCGNGIIVSCQQNELLTEKLARNCSVLSESQLGGIFGYETEQECEKSKETRVLFMTLKKLFTSSFNDSKFSQYSCIIFQNSLKRTIEADLLLEVFRECIKERQNFKLILLLSPYEKASKFSDYFSESASVEVYNTPNIILPIRTIWKKTTSSLIDDYINEVVDTALAIHAMNDPGDVLAFLATPQDVDKTSEILMYKLQEYYYCDVECIKLYENSVDQSVLNSLDRVQASNRRFILATSWAEMLVLTSVSYVIDSGRMNEFHHIPDKHVDLLTMSFISRARAKIRRACSGRCKSGVCYRLYSKENYIEHMLCDELPELLVQNPFNTIVKMFQYQPKRAMTLEFVESPRQGVIKNALDLLKNYNAIKDGMLTTLGEYMIKLPFLPRYSKLIILGIQWGFAYETIVLVAFFLVKGSVFCHASADEQQKTIDSMKLHFVQYDSDTLTYLHIYSEWTKNNFKQSWCVKNCIDGNMLQNVKVKVNEICCIVNKNLKEDIPVEIKDYKEADWIALQDIIFDCFKDNLCVFTGHFRSGYRLLSAQCVTFLHPSSSILQKENLPQFIVFDHIQSTFRDFMVTVTSVPKSVVLSAVKNGSLQVKHSDLFERKLVPLVIESVGVMMIKHVLLGKKGKKLREIEELIKKETKSDLIVIEPSVEKGSVSLYTLPECRDKAKEIVRNILDNKLESMLYEEETLILELKKGQTKVSIGVTWEKGAKTTSVKICPNVLGASMELKSKNVDDLWHNETSVKYSINLTWPRLLCRGFGFVSFSTDEDFMYARRLSMKIVRIKNVEAEIQIDKKRKNQLYITRLPPEITDLDLKQAIENLLPYIKVEKSTVILNHAFETSENDLDLFRKGISSACHDFGEGDECNIVVPKPENAAKLMKAYINMKSFTSIERVTKLLNNNLKIDNVIVNADPMCYSSHLCSIDVFRALEDQFNRHLKILENKLRSECEYKYHGDFFQFEAKIHDGSTARLKLITHDSEIMNILRRTVHELLEGEIISCNAVKGLHKLFTHGGHLWLRTLEKAEDVIVVEEYKSKSLRLYGSPEACQSAKKRILEFLQGTENEIVKIINLSNGKNARTLLKGVIKKYGVNLENFIELHQLRSAELNIRSCQLVLHGCLESIQSAKTGLEQLAETSISDVQCELLSSQEMCPVCACPALQLTFRLEYCGHLYCAECIRSLIVNAKFPILCCAENCNKELILEDIRKALDYEKDEIDHLLDLSMTEFISENRTHLSYCPAPDCSMFFDTRDFLGETWNCPLCHNDICIKCNVIFHRGYTCGMYQGTKRDANYSYKVWLKDQRANCKECPKCRTGIEKNQGCNHMTCSSCHTHFCWLCCQAFPTANGVYNHLPFCKANQTPHA